MCSRKVQGRTPEFAQSCSTGPLATRQGIRNRGRAAEDYRPRRGKVVKVLDASYDSEPYDSSFYFFPTRTFYPLLVEGSKEDVSISRPIWRRCLVRVGIIYQ